MPSILGLPFFNALIIAKSWFSVTGWRKILLSQGWFRDASHVDKLFGIFLARFGPMFAKYWLKYLAISIGHYILVMNLIFISFGQSASQVHLHRSIPTKLWFIEVYWQRLVIIYLHGSKRMGVLVRSLLLLVPLLQSRSERVTFTHRPLVDKFCLFFFSERFNVQEHQYCHWHCMKNPTYNGVNYEIAKT